MHPFPIVFNLCLEDIARILDSQIGLTDPIILTNGLPLCCLWFSVNFQKCTGSSKTNWCPLNEYCNKWLLKINLIKTKALISQKENRKSTRDKYSFLIGIKSPISQNTLIWALRLTQMEVFKFPNNHLQRKQKINIYLVQNAILNLTSF